MIRCIPYLTHNMINKSFDRLALLCKIISQNLKIIPSLFQLNHINKSQVALAQYFSKSSGFSRVCHKLVWLTNDLSVVVPSDNFHGFLIDWAKIMYIEISFVSLQQGTYFSSRLLNLFQNDNVQYYNHL